MRQVSNSVSQMYSHREIVSVLSFGDMLSFLSGVNNDDYSNASRNKFINSLHFSNMKGNADYCFISSERIDFKALNSKGSRGGLALRPSSSKLDGRAFPTLQEPITKKP